MYEGKEIGSIHDLISNFKLDNYEEAKRKRELLENEEHDRDPDKIVPTSKDVDKDYWDMLQPHRPNGPYYEHSNGDKLLFLKKVDKIDYDLVSAFRARK